MKFSCACTTGLALVFAVACSGAAALDAPHTLHHSRATQPHLSETHHAATHHAAIHTSTGAHAATASSAPVLNLTPPAKTSSGSSTTRPPRRTAPPAWKTSSSTSAPPTRRSWKPTPASSPRRSPNRSARSASRFTSPPCRASPGGNPPPPLRPVVSQFEVQSKRSCRKPRFS